MTDQDQAPERVRLIPLKSTWTCPNCERQNVYNPGVVSDPQDKCFACGTQVTIGAVRDLCRAVECNCSSTRHMRGPGTHDTRCPKYDADKEAMRSLLAAIITDLPISRDWLDPELEKEMRAAVRYGDDFNARAVNSLPIDNERLYDQFTQLAQEQRADHAAKDAVIALGNAIAEAAIKAGIIDGKTPLTDPQLVMLCDDLANARSTVLDEAIQKVKAKAREFASKPHKRRDEDAAQLDAAIEIQWALESMKAPAAPEDAENQAGSVDEEQPSRADRARKLAAETDGVA